MNTKNQKINKILTKLFSDVERPKKLILIGMKPTDCAEIIYADADKDYQAIFASLLETCTDLELTKLISELTSVNDEIIQSFQSSLYAKNTNKTVETMKKIAKYSTQYPQTADLIMKFYQNIERSVNSTDVYGSTALSSLLKEGQETALHFLINHGATLFSLRPNEKKFLEAKNSNLYEKARINDDILIQKYSYK